ncbi:PAS domain-containing protein [Caloramator sp. Dgby_cultured_2]|uniref:PAS domain-containing protein n=1 Tax=Caloramator sp. Dgby_cultured_2 TaxID=3029174 RepID=UPI00406CB301
MTDLECKVTYYSASVSRILGYDSKELIGTNLQSIVHPEDLDEAKRNFILI